MIMSVSGRSTLMEGVDNISKRKAAVVRVVDNLLQDVKDVSYNIQDPRNPAVTPDEMIAAQLVEAVSELRVVVHHRLYFSPTFHYLYASQVARHAARSSMSGECVSTVEKRLTEAQKVREEAVEARDALIASLTKQLRQLDTDGAQAVLACRQETKAELEDVRNNSENNLQELKVHLQESQETMASHEQRHHNLELLLRKRRQELESEIQGVIVRYDGTMSRLQTSLDQLRHDYAHYSHLLHHQRELLAEVERRYLDILAEKQRLEEQRLAAMQAEFRREHAARTIQRAWQHYKMRKMLKKAQRKRKKRPKDTKEGKK